ncbi:hypothetical protein ACFVP0_27135 [Streptomyces cinereoruber]|uniref:hypothetical protein n=1 Tax=Streptomyces cinereoruber TaxID=67260 RepID=UPI0036BC4E3F
MLHTDPAAPDLGPAPAPPGVTTVALYATGTDPDAVRGDLAAAADLAARRSWTVPDGAAIADTWSAACPPRSRHGWDRVRGLAAQRRIHGVVVPAPGHIGFTWALWAAEQRHLRRHGVFLASVAPLLPTAPAGEYR